MIFKKKKSDQDKPSFAAGDQEFPPRQLNLTDNKEGQRASPFADTNRPAVAEPEPSRPLPHEPPKDEEHTATSPPGGPATPGSATKRFSIEQAIRLVKEYPRDEVEPHYIARIMRQTLEAVNVPFYDIIEQAHKRESQIHGLSDKIHEKIDELKKQIQSLEADLERLQNRLDETVEVREFLQLADDIRPEPQGVHAPVDTPPTGEGRPEEPDTAHSSASQTPESASEEIIEVTEDQIEHATDRDKTKQAGRERAPIDATVLFGSPGNQQPPSH